MNDKLRLGSFEGRPCDLICAEVSAKTSEITISTNLLLSISSLFHIKIYFTRTQTHSHNSESHFNPTNRTSLDFGGSQNTEYQFRTGVPVRLYRYNSTNGQFYKINHKTQWPV